MIWRRKIFLYVGWFKYGCNKIIILVLKRYLFKKLIKWCYFFFRDVVYVEVEKVRVFVIVVIEGLLRFSLNFFV